MWADSRGIEGLIPMHPSWKFRSNDVLNYRTAWLKPCIVLHHIYSGGALCGQGPGNEVKRCISSAVFRFSVTSFGVHLENVWYLSNGFERFMKKSFSLGSLALVEYSFMTLEDWRVCFQRTSGLWSYSDYGIYVYGIIKNVTYFSIKIQGVLI